MQLESDGKLFNCVLGDGHAQKKKLDIPCDSSRNSFFGTLKQSRVYLTPKRTESLA